MLRGTVIQAREDYLVIDVQGVGYKVYAPKVSGIPREQVITLFTYLQVREDALTLFGFREQQELELFELLISVSGMGPKTALGVLTYLEPDQIRRAVLEENLAVLTAIPGVGKKTAQRLVLELKDKLKNGYGQDITSKREYAGVVDEALGALTALGYSTLEAKNALAKISKEESLDLEAIIKSALKVIR